MDNTTNFGAEGQRITYETPSIRIINLDHTEPDLSDEEIEKICGTMINNPWIHDGCYECFGIIPGDEVTLENYKMIKYTSPKGFTGITERNENGDVLVTTIRPNGEKSTEINYGIMNGQELAIKIYCLETNDHIGLLDSYDRNIERIAAEKNISMDEALEYYRERNQEERNRVIREICGKGK